MLGGWDWLGERRIGLEVEELGGRFSAKYHPLQDVQNMGSYKTGQIKRRPYRSYGLQDSKQPTCTLVF